MEDPWITTFTGKHFIITRATVYDICIEDIAHGLSNCCRYVGQCKTFYSVAEHSVRMAEMLTIPEAQLAALLHDGSEAYLGDVSTGVKHLLPLYMEIEKIITYLIYDKYGIRHCPLMNFDLDTVKALDIKIRTPEVTSLFTQHDGWNFSWTKVECDYGRIQPWSQKKAEKKFLEMFRRLYEHT